MEENIFDSYLEGYTNIHNELIDLDVSDKTEEIERLQKVIEANDMLVQNYMSVEDIDSNDKEKRNEFEINTKQYMENIKNAEKEIEEIQTKQEENEKKKEQLQNVQKTIRDRARQRKEEILAEEVKKEKEDTLTKRYDAYLVREADVKKQLEKFKDIELETTEQEVERIHLDNELRNIRKEMKEVARTNQSKK